jgi:hypothetical protein
MFRHRWLIALAAIAAAFVLVTADAHARAGGGFSGGSRGMTRRSSNREGIEADRPRSAASHSERTSSPRTSIISASEPKI